MGNEIVDNLGDDYYSVSFRIMGDDLDSSEISKIFEITPDKSYKKGDPHIQITKKGKYISHGNYSFGLWAINSNVNKYSQLSDHLDDIIERLEPKRDVSGL